MYLSNIYICIIYLLIFIIKTFGITYVYPVVLYM